MARRLLISTGMCPHTAHRMTLRIEDLDQLCDELDDADWIDVDPLAQTAIYKKDGRRSPTGRSRIRRAAPRWAGYGH